MVQHPIAPNKPLLVSVSSPSVTSNTENGPAHWLQSHNPILNFVREISNSNAKVNNDSCPDMSLLANLYQPKMDLTTASTTTTNTATPTALSTQTLYRAMMQQFAGLPSEPSNPPQLLSTLYKRFSPETRSSPPPAPLPAPLPTPAEPPIPALTGASATPNFAMTAAITSALSSNATIVGSQVLPACSPLLQLAVRQALSQCLPHFAQLNIQGHLEISVGSAQSTQSATVLKFNDPSSPVPPSMSPVVSSAEKPHVNGFSGTDASMECTRPATTVTDDVDNGNEMIHDPAHSSGQYGASSSRRKSTNPIKCTVAEASENQVPVTGLSLSPALSVGNNDSHNNSNNNNTGTSPLLPHPNRSSPISPSTDSGVLDLSRNGSLAGSAPITPLKDLSLTHHPVSVEALGETAGRSQLLEAYQKQLAAFSQYHSVWNRTMLFGSLDTRANGEVTVPGPSASLFQTAANGTLSAPNSPIKPVRRQRVNTGCGLGSSGSNGQVGSGSSHSHRLSSAVRRPSSNRRFPCNQCREEFPSLHTLEEHTMCQHGTYRCHICKAQFTQRSNLQRHALKHVGFKPFECRVCSKAYYRKDHLMRHMEMGHPGYTPRENITVHLTSSESLDYLNRSNPQQGLGQSIEPGETNGVATLHSSPGEITDHGIEMDLDDEDEIGDDRIEGEGMEHDEPHPATNDANRQRFESTGSPHESVSFGEVAEDDEELDEAAAHSQSQFSVASEVAQDEEDRTAVAHMSPEAPRVTSPSRTNVDGGGGSPQFDCVLVTPSFAPYARGPQEHRQMSV